MSAIRRTAVVLAAVVTSLVLGTTVALAQWTTSGAGTGSASTTTINPPVAASAAGASPTTVTVSVTTGPSSGAPAHGYRVDRTSPSAATGVCFISGTTGSCTASATAGSGTQTYNVVSYRGTTSLQYWSSAPLTGVTGTPTNAPTVAVSQPTANQNFNNNGAMNNNCGASTTGICGTATAGSGTLGTGAVTLTLRRTVGSTITFWNGSAWVASSSNLTATGTTSWSYSIGYATLRTGVANGTSATYLVTATVTDSLNATGTAQRTFTTS